MTYERNSYELPAVAPQVREYEWHDHVHDVERDAIIMRIDTNHLPERPRERPRQDN